MFLFIFIFTSILPRMLIVFNIQHNRYRVFLILIKTIEDGTIDNEIVISNQTSR